jgi:hypothetical protein
MAQYTVQAPDGKIITLEGPAGASQEEILSQAQKLYAQQVAPSAKAPMAEPYDTSVESMAAGIDIPVPTEPMQFSPTGQAVRGVIKGAVVDPLTGIAQMVGGAGTRQQLAEYEKAYQERRKREGADGIEWSRLVGNVASSILPGGAAGAAARAAGAGKVLTGTAAGAGGAALLPVTQTPEEAQDPSTFALQKLRDVGFSAAVGGAISKIGASLTPELKEGVAEQLALGVKVSPGQAYGGVPGWLFRQMESMKFGPFEKTVRNSFTRSAGNEVLKSIDATVPETIKDGMQMSGYIQKTIQNYYDTALEKLGRIVPDKQFAADLRTVVADNVSSMTPRAKKIFESSIQKEVIDRFGLGPVPKGAIAPLGMKQLPSAKGIDLKNINNFLKEQAEKYGKKTGTDNEALAAGFEDALNAFRSYTTRVDTDGLIAKADDAWAKLYRFADAASSAKAIQQFKGSFSAEELAQAATRQATELQAGAGAGPLGEFARKGVNVLGGPPDELGVGYRQAVIGSKLATGVALAAFNPGLAIPVLVASGISYGAAAKLMKNPSAARVAVEQAIQRLGPQAAGAIMAREEMKAGQIAP